MLLDLLILIEIGLKIEKILPFKLLKKGVQTWKTCSEIFLKIDLEKKSKKSLKKGQIPLLKLYKKFHQVMYNSFEKITLTKDFLSILKSDCRF